MAGKDQQVALVVGASRGIGRQVAIDLAKNGYTGRSADVHRREKLLMMNSGGVCEVYQRRVRDDAIPSRPELAAIDHQYC